MGKHRTQIIRTQTPVNNKLVIKPLKAQTHSVTLLEIRLHENGTVTLTFASSKDLHRVVVKSEDFYAFVDDISLDTISVSDDSFSYTITLTASAKDFIVKALDKRRRD